VSIKDKILDLKNLLQETGEAHHQAYIETDGEDPEWPLWYAGFLKEKVNRLLNKTYTETEIVHYLLMAEENRSIENTDAHWTDYYARFMVERS
jgi:hypothetical protein